MITIGSAHLDSSFRFVHCFGISTDSMRVTSCGYTFLHGLDFFSDENTALDRTTCFTRGVWSSELGSSSMHGYTVGRLSVKSRFHLSWCIGQVGRNGGSMYYIPSSTWTVCLLDLGLICHDLVLVIGSKYRPSTASWCALDDKRNWVISDSILLEYGP